MGPEPDQPTPTPSSDQADSDTAATTHHTGKRTNKGEIEDVYTWGDTKKVSDTNWHHFWKLTLSYMSISDCCRTEEPLYMPNMMIRLARQQVVQVSLSSCQ